MGNPRRDAFEYGVLLTLGTSMAAAYAFLIAYSSQKQPDGTRRRLPKVNLDDAFEPVRAWEELKVSIWDMARGRPSPPPSSPTSAFEDSKDGKP